MEYGDTLRFQYLFEDALRTYDQAAEEFRSLGKEVDAARTRTGWAWA
jgi:hypothetical protein